MFKIFSRKSASPRENLLQIIGDGELPTFPETVVKAMQQIRDDSAALGEIADTLAADPGISVRILRTVNSARYALRNQVNNLHLAVSLLGRSEIQSLLVTVGVQQALPGADTPGFEQARFWRTASRRAAVAKALAERCDPSTASEAYSAALLQDMAVPVLAHKMGEAYGATLQAWHAGSDELFDLERQQFGWDHAEVGGWMAEEWGFPADFVQAIAAHHGGESPLPTTQMVAGIREVEEEGQDVIRVVEAAEGRLGLGREELAELIQAAQEQAPAVQL